MEFELSEENRMFQAMVRDFALKEVVPGAAKRDEEGAFPFEQFKKMGELGMLGIGFPEEYVGR